MLTIAMPKTNDGMMVRWFLISEHVVCCRKTSIVSRSRSQSSVALRFVFILLLKGWLVPSRLGFFTSSLVIRNQFRHSFFPFSFFGGPWL